MKTKTLILFLIIGAAFVAALAYRLTSAEHPANEPAPSGADALRIDDANYDRVVSAAQAGDCDAAFRLGRHHAFFSRKDDEAIRWYRIAAKCPHVGAKGELVAMLLNDPEHDREVDRLLLEIEQLDPKAVESDRKAVAQAREYRQRTGN